MIGAQVYEITVYGRLPEAWLDVFADMQVSVAEEECGPVTPLRGCLPDQAALHGMLQNLYGLGLGLIKVGVVEENQVRSGSLTTNSANLNELHE